MNIAHFIFNVFLEFSGKKQDAFLQTTPFIKSRQTERVKSSPQNFDFSPLLYIFEFKLFTQVGFGGISTHVMAK